MALEFQVPELQVLELEVEEPAGKRHPRFFLRPASALCRLK
jgi:hypothetical protein